MDEEAPALDEIVAKIAESFSMDARTAAASAVQYDDGDGDRMTLSSGANSAADVNIMLKELVSERDGPHLPSDGNTAIAATAVQTARDAARGRRVRRALRRRRPRQLQRRRARRRLLRLLPPKCRRIPLQVPRLLGLRHLRQVCELCRMLSRSVVPNSCLSLQV